MGEISGEGRGGVCCAGLEQSRELLRSTGKLIPVVNRLLNFQIGLEVTEGLTFNRRSYNYPVGDYSQQRIDLMIGLKAAWILPFYTKRIVEYNRGEP